MKHKGVWLAAALLALSIVFEALYARPHHPEFAWHFIPGHMALIGLLAALLVTLLAKTIGAAVLQRKEDYDER